MKKRALSLVLALTLVLALALPVQAADEPEIYWFDGEYGSEIIDGWYGEGMTAPWGEADPDAMNLLELSDYVFNASNNTVTTVPPAKTFSSPDYDDLFYSGEGPYRVSKPSGYSTVYGYADETGKVVIPLIYDYANPFYEGTAVVRKDDENDNSTFYLIDATGKVLKTLDYDRVDPYTAGYYPVSKKTADGTTLYGLIDASGNLAYDINGYDLGWTNYLGNGLFSYRVEYNYDYNTGAINTNGDVVIPADYYYVFVTHGLYCVETYTYDEETHVTTWRHGLYDSTGKLLIPLDIINYELISGGYNTSYKDGKWSLFELGTGKTIISDSEYRPYDSGWGLIAGYIEGEAYDALFTPAETFCVWDHSGNVIIDGLDNVCLSGRYVFVARGNKIGYFINPCCTDERSDTMMDITSANSWAAAPVDWALSNGYTLSLTPIYFGADSPCPRWEVVSMLWKASGCPEPVTTVNPFSDVSPDADYYKAVLWAVENGITTGFTDGTFKPYGTVNRAQAVTFLHRAAKLPAVSGTADFPDIKDVLSWAGDAITWAASLKITTGAADGKFYPTDPVTRAQMITFLYRMKVENNL